VKRPRAAKLCEICIRVRDDPVFRFPTHLVHSEHGNPQKRAAYDRKLNAWQTPVEESSNVGRKVVLALVVIFAIAVYYHHNKQEQVRLEAAKAIAVGKAKEAEEKRKAEVELASIELQRQRQDKLLDERQRAQREAEMQRYRFDNRFDETRSAIYGDRSQIMRERERTMQQRAEAQKNREQQREAIAAQQQLAREKAYLCQIERNRYGRALSC
jgi:hypothetical protein